MGALGTFACLKAEVDNFTRTGAQFLTQDPAHLTPLLHNYLSSSAEGPHDDMDGMGFYEK